MKNLEKKSYNKTMSAETCFYEICSLEEILARNQSGFAIFSTFFSRDEYKEKFNMSISDEDLFSFNLSRHETLKNELSSKRLKFYEIDGVHLDENGKEVSSEFSLLVPYRNEFISFHEFSSIVAEILKKYKQKLMILVRPNFLDSKAVYQYFESDVKFELQYDDSYEKLASAYLTSRKGTKSSCRFGVKGYRIPKSFNDAMFLSKKGYCWEK